MSKFAYEVALFITYVMVILGIALSSIAVHEFTHVIDIKNEGGIVKNVCLFNIPFDKDFQAAGFVNWDATNADQAIFIAPELWPSINGYVVMGILMFIFGYTIKYKDKYGK